MVEVFNFIKVIIMAVLFIVIFAFMSPMVNDSVDNWKATITDQPLLTFFIGGLNFWIFIGLMLGILAGIVYGTGVWGGNNA